LPGHLWGSPTSINGSNLPALALHGLAFSTPVQTRATWLGDFGDVVPGYELAVVKLEAVNQNPEVGRESMAELIEGRRAKLTCTATSTALQSGTTARSPRTFTISSFLQDYYDNEAVSFGLASTLGRPTAAYRFNIS
jgi:hypothetical protein